MEFIKRGRKFEADFRDTNFFLASDSPQPPSGGESSPSGGGGVLEPKSPKICVPKTAPINISFCTFHFFPL